MRSDLRAALGEGRGVTAKIRWLTRADEDGEGEGRPRWIHCTPLFGHSGAVGVWMIVLVDEDNNSQGSSGRRFRAAPPVSDTIGGKQWDAKALNRDRRQLNSYDAAETRRGDANITRNNSAFTDSGARPGSAVSKKDHGVASGDVSEFSFQLK